MFVAICNLFFRKSLSPRIIWTFFTLLLVHNAALPLAVGGEIAFFYALDADLAILRSECVSEKTSKVGEREIHRFRRGPWTINAAKMRAGAVETAITAEAVFSLASISRAFSAGPAGGLDPELVIGRWHGISGIAPYQMGTETGAGFVGIPVEAIEPPGSLQLVPAVLASGETFIASGRERDRIRGLTGASLVDMNSAGLVRAAAHRGVPLTMIRIVSDHADQNASAAFAAFVKTYDGEGGKLFLKWLEELPPDKNSPSNYPNLRRLLSK